MKPFCLLLAAGCWLLAASCGEKAQKAEAPRSLTDKEQLLMLADHTGHFTDPATLTRLVPLRADAGKSAGTAHNLLLLVSATSPLQLIWAAQTKFQIPSPFPILPP